ncbi:MAG: hypothetical protein II145_09290, partial [Selenomonas sp.]|nr:hypothetical protein [Selenomonas sp.]
MEALRRPRTLDNKRSGSVIEELQANVKAGSRLAIISAGFSLYAFAALQRELQQAAEVRFIFSGALEADGAGLHLQGDEE